MNFLIVSLLCIISLLVGVLTGAVLWMKGGIVFQRRIGDIEESFLAHNAGIRNLRVDLDQCRGFIARVAPIFQQLQVVKAEESAQPRPDTLPSEVQPASNVVPFSK